MPKFYLPTFGSGLGHATRLHALAEKLKLPGDQFLYSSFDEGFAFLSSKGERVNRCPSIDLQWNDVGGFSSRNSFIRFPRIVLTFSEQVAFEAEMISRFRPNLVLSDSRLSAVFASRAKSCPIITILNQFKILFPPRFRGNLVSSFFEKIEGNILGLFWSLSDEVLMPDLPPPYTIGTANVEGVESSGRLKYIGFMSNNSEISNDKIRKARSILSLDDRPLVFIPISGPSATKRRFMDISLEAARELSPRYNFVISLGESGGSQIPTKLSNNVWVYEWCPIKDELFALSKSVVVRGGHTTISQCINFGKPAVYVPIANHSEQIWNTQRCESLGIGVQLTSEKLTRKTLVDSIEICISNPTMINKLEKLGSISKRFDGFEMASQIVRSYL